MHTLLLADDSITIQRVIALTFADEAFRVITVSDGQQAIDRMASQRPDIVLAGTTMPHVTGYDVARYMRTQPALKDVPVLLLTGAFETVDEERLKASGASGTLEKPFEPTIVISRVKELLGIKSNVRPAPSTGRLVTSAETHADKRTPRPPLATPPKDESSHPAPPPSSPPRPSPAASWDELREESGLEADTRSVEGGRDGYLDTLDAAFDTLDAQLAKRPGNAGAPPRNPDSPISRSSGPADPRSPGRLPAVESQSAPPNPIFEVDDGWFADDERVREERRVEQQQLAAEMGIHDVDLPAIESAPGSVPAADLDLDFGMEDRESRPTRASEAASFSLEAREAFAAFEAPVAQGAPADVDVVSPPPAPVDVVVESPPPAAVDVVVAMPPPAPEDVVVASPPPAPEDVVVAWPPAPVAAIPAPPPVRIASVVLPTAIPQPPVPVADAFAELLAYEQGDRPLPAFQEAPVPFVVQAPAPEITDAMLDQIAEKVADRLHASSFGDQLRAALAATVRDTVRNVVSETSEKLVRDEIARIKAKAELDSK